ncbi:MAG: DUF3782 domain-containing protein [Magnetococcales bacterium]|nr:DUF3782 domain-containing protein [Magnetococcales bacterium]MBF0117061.1 DUF3782 domain-containing protein [Magnetococcales bacterium]
MSNALTVDDVLKMFRETSRLFQESQASWEKRHQETERAIWEARAESERAFRELADAQQKTERQSQETDRKIQETAAQMRETDRKIKEVSKNIDKLGGRLGEFVEGLVAPACKTLFTNRGIEVHKVSRRVEAYLPGGRKMEIDLLVDNTDSIALVEVKSKLAVDDVRAHLGKMSEFKEFFPEHAGKRAFAAVAAMVIEENVCRFAIHSGLFVIEQVGDTLRMANDAQFQAKVW